MKLRVVAIVLAAGRSVRMGRDKLALPFGKSTVLEESVAPFLACERLDEVVVVVQPGYPIPDSLAGARVVENPGYVEGMASSLRAGVRAVEADIYLLGLGDKPRLDAHTIKAVLNATFEDAGEIVVPVYGGQRGHPVALRSRFRTRLLSVRGDSGAREVLAAHRHDVAEVWVDDPGVVFDVDRPGDLT